MPIDYVRSRELLDERFANIEQSALTGVQHLPDEDLDRIFASDTQAYREVLLGCVLARWCDQTVDLTKPYVGQGDRAFNGRTLDERVVNRFLHENRIPSSRGPYLGVFRRSVEFLPATRAGVRDKAGYDALLRIIDRVAATPTNEDVVSLLDQILFRFFNLREASLVAIARLQRVSLEQITTLVTRLISIPSGGRFPMFLVEATFTAINERFGLGWIVEVQGINISDAAEGFAGDIQVRKDDTIIYAAEVTERPIGSDRLIATFQTKISPNAIEDYLFITSDGVTDDAKTQARAYFALGHEVNFVQIVNWITYTLASLGSDGRTSFFATLISCLERNDTPAALKASWNQEIDRLTRAV